MLLNRKQLKDFITVAKQTFEIRPSDVRIQVQLSEDTDTVSLSIHHADIWLEWKQSGKFGSDSLIVPRTALVEGSQAKANEIEITQDGGECVIAWKEKGIPQLRRFPQGELSDRDPFPAPEGLVRLDDRFRLAIGEAVQTVDRSSSRYALGCLQLRGKKKELVATDSRELLIQGGFEWPWEDDLLVPAIRSLHSSVIQKLDSGTPTAVGRNDSHVILRFGPWRMALPIVTDSRYPDVDLVIPFSDDLPTKLTLGETDRRFLDDTLPHLATSEEDIVTVELNGSVIVRSAGKDQSPGTELALVQSRKDGSDLAINSGRLSLLRAARLGFAEFGLRDSKTAIVGRRGNDTFVWMPFTGDPIPSSATLHRIRSADSEIVSESKPQPDTQKGNAMTHPGNSNATTQSPGADSDQVDQLVIRATEIKTKLRDLQNDVQDLITALRTQKKQAKLVRSTIDSLQKLRTLKV